MTGIIFLAVAFIWLATSLAIVRWMIVRAKSLLVKVFIAFFLPPVLLLSPIADEIIGKQQFEKLCKNTSSLKIDAAKARGQSIFVEIKPRNEIVTGQVLQTRHSHHSYRISSSGEEIASYDTYQVEGGWLIHALGISEGNAPLLITRPWCGPDNEGNIRKIYQFKQLN